MTSRQKIPIDRRAAAVGLLHAVAVVFGYAILTSSPSQAAAARIEYSVRPMTGINDLSQPGQYVGVTGITDQGAVFYTIGSTSDASLKNYVHTWKDGIVTHSEPVPGHSNERVAEVRPNGGYMAFATTDTAAGTPGHSVYVSAEGTVTHLPSRIGDGTGYFHHTDGNGIFAGLYTPDTPPTNYYFGSVLRQPDGSTQILDYTGISQITDDGWVVGTVQEITGVFDGFVTYQNHPTIWIKGQPLIQLDPSDGSSFSSQFVVRSEDRTTMMGIVGVSSWGGAAYMSYDGQVQLLTQRESHRTVNGVSIVEWMDVDDFNAANASGVAVGFATGRRYLGTTTSVGDPIYQRNGFAYKWDVNNGMQFLGDLIDPALNLRLDDAVAINDLGQIVVRGHAFGSGIQQWYLLSPVPEPSVAALSGMAVLLASRRRRAT